MSMRNQYYPAHDELGNPVMKCRRRNRKYWKARYSLLIKSAGKYDVRYCTPDEFKTIWRRHHRCTYCHRSEALTLDKYPKGFIIARRDYDLGYTVDNLVWSCPACNARRIRNSGNLDLSNLPI